MFNEEERATIRASLEKVIAHLDAGRLHGISLAAVVSTDAESHPSNIESLLYTEEASSGSIPGLAGIISSQAFTLHARIAGFMGRGDRAAQDDAQED